MRSRFIYFSFTVLLLGMLLMLTPHDAHAVTVNLDSFSDTSLVTAISSSSGTVTDVDEPVTSARGGVRDLSLTHISGSGAVTLDVDTGLEQLSFASASGTRGNFTIRWDGSVGDATPSLNVDLSDSGNNDGILLSVYADQIGWQLQIDARDQGDTTTATYSFTENEDIRATGRIYYIPFADFTNAAVLTGGNVGAVDITITGVNDLDLTIDFFEAVDITSGLFDFGDLPEDGTPQDYNSTLQANNGAGHLNPGTTIRIGSEVDTEVDGQPNADATGDDAAGSPDDEDGVTWTGLWNDASGHVTVNIQGSVNGCLSAWLDWHDGTFAFGADGDFDDALEKIIDNQPVTVGDNNFTFTVLGFNDASTMFARFRVVPDRDDDGSCVDQASLFINAIVEDGEVEDHDVGFSPTAVSLQSFSADSAATPAVLFGSLMMLLLISGATVYALHRRQSLQLIEGEIPQRD